MNSATEMGVSFGELVTVAVFIVGALWGLVKSMAKQFKTTLDQQFIGADTKATQRFTAVETRVDQRFATIDEKLKSFDPLHGELARVDKDLVQVRLEMATNFVRQEGLRNMQTRMEQLFTEVFDKLDSKADKATCDKVHRQ